MGLASLTGGSDECAWYFWNFTVDSSGEHGTEIHVLDAFHTFETAPSLSTFPFSFVPEPNLPFYGCYAVGLMLMIIMIKSLECWAGRYPAHSWQRLYVAKSGDYGEPPSCNIWGYQTVSADNLKHMHSPAAFKTLHV